MTMIDITAGEIDKGLVQGSSQSLPVTAKQRSARRHGRASRPLGSAVTDCGSRSWDRRLRCAWPRHCSYLQRIGAALLDPILDVGAGRICTLRAAYQMRAITREMAAHRIGRDRSQGVRTGGDSDDHCINHGAHRLRVDAISLSGGAVDHHPGSRPVARRHLLPVLDHAATEHSERVHRQPWPAGIDWLATPRRAIAGQTRPT